MKKRLKKIVVSLLIVLVTTNAFANEKTGFMNNIKNLKEISDIMDIIQENFVGDKKINKTLLMQGAIKGMIESLEDPHSNYFSKDGMADLEEKINGEYSGIGAIIKKFPNEPVTVELLIEGTPSFKAGVRPNDKILEIDGKSTYNMEVEEASKLLRGKAGTTLTIKIYRESEKKDKEIKLVRENIKLENVRSKMLDNNI